MAAASSSAAQDLDEKSLMSFVDDAIDLDCSEWGEGGGSSGPSSSILQAPPSIRSGNYKAASLSSSSLTTGPLSSASASFSSRKLPDIALDLSGSSGPAAAGSPNGGHLGTNSVSLPSPSSSSSASSSPQHHSEAKKKPFLMAIGLNEVIATNDDNHEDHHDHADDHSTAENDRSAMQAKHASSSPANGGNGRSPKKFQLGLPQKSPSYTLASPKSNTSPTGGNGSKLLPIGFGGGTNNGGGSASPHSLLKFDPIMGSSGKCVDLEGGGGAKSRAACTSLSSSRKTIASRSPLRDRSILGISSESEFTIAPPKSTTASFSSSSSPSKLDPLDAESIRASTFAPTGASMLVPERKTSLKLPRSSFSLGSSSSPEKAQPQSPQQETKSIASSSSDKPPEAAAPATAQPKFRNPFKKNAASGDKSAKSTAVAAQDDDIDLLGDSRHSSIAQVPVATLAPMDEFNCLSFSLRAGGGGKQSARDLPSLSLSSDTKDIGDTSASSSKSPAKKTKKSKDKDKQQQQQDQEVK